MQVYNLPSGLQQLQRVNSVDATQKQQGNLRTDGNVVGPIDSSLDKPEQQTPRFDVSDQALAIVEQNYESNQLSRNSQNSTQQDNASRYDQPSSRNQSAVSAYQNVNNLSQREDIQSVFGVDLFA